MPKAIGHDENIEDAVVVDGEAEDLSVMQEDIDREMQSIFLEFGGDPVDVEFEIKVKKVEKNTGKASHCFNATPQELPLTDRIKEEYGPGLYQIWVYKNGTRFRKRELRIAEKMKAPIDKILQENKQDIASLVTTMMVQQRESMRQMQDIIGHQTPAAPAGQMDQVTAMLAMMAQMKEFMTPQQPAFDPMNMFIKGIEVMKDVSGGGGEKNFHDVILSVIKDVAPSLLEITKRTQQVGERPPQPGQPTPPGQPENSQITDQTGANQMTEQERQVIETFRSHVNTLVNMAKSQQDPGLWAEVVYSQMAPVDLQGLIPRPDIVEVLAQYNAEVKTLTPWFIELRSHLQAMMEDDGIWPATTALETPPGENGLTTEPDSINTVENNDLQSGVVDVEISEPDAAKLNSESSQDT